MKTNTLRVLSGCTAAAAFVWCWYLLRMQDDSAPRIGGKVPAGVASASVRTTSPPPAVNWPDIGTPQFKSMAGERAQPWLDARGRDAAGLVAMWDLTGDNTFLTEAAKKFPNDPAVCMSVIGMAEGNTFAALPWIDRLLAAEPKNPHAWQLKAWALSRQKDQAGALAAINQAASAGGPRDTHAGARASTVREAALASGMSPGNAARLAIGPPVDRMTSCRVSSGINQIILTEFEAAKAASDEERLMKITGLGFHTALSMIDDGPVTLRDERMSNTLAQTLLADLPGDTELGPGGRTAGSLKSELLVRRQYLDETNAHYSEAYEGYRTAGDDLVVAYADCFLRHGEQTAMSLWLAEPKPEKAVP